MCVRLVDLVSLAYVWLHLAVCTVQSSVLDPSDRDQVEMRMDGTLATADGFDASMNEDVARLQGLHGASNGGEARGGGLGGGQASGNIENPMFTGDAVDAGGLGDLDMLDALDIPGDMDMAGMDMAAMMGMDMAGMDMTGLDMAGMDMAGMDMAMMGAMAEMSDFNDMDALDGLDIPS